jgi:hypothetical protein
VETTSGKHLFRSSLSFGSHSQAFVDYLLKKEWCFRCVFIQDKSGAKFSLGNKKYLDQLKKDLVMNVLQGGDWGSYRHTLIGSEEAALNVEHAYINALTRGDLSSLRWIEGPLSFYKYVQSILQPKYI